MLVHILPSACRHGLQYVVCKSGMLCPYQQNICYLKGGFCTLDYPDSAIIYRVASHPQESIPSLHFRHLATTASSWFGLTICTVSLSVLRYFSSFRQSRHIWNFCHSSPPPSYHIYLMLFVHWIIDRGFHLIVNLGCFQDLIHVNCQEAHD